MSSTIKTTSALAAFAVVALMAGPAIAGTPLNVVQKKALADAKLQQLSQPGQATATGGDTVQVPEELHNYLHAQVDNKSNVRILETDGPTAPAKAEEQTK